MQAARDELVAVREREVEARDQRALFRVAADRTSEPRLVVDVVSDVIGVMVGAQDVAHRQPELGDLREDRAGRTPGVDEDRASSGLVGHEVGVRQPARIHRALDDHGGLPNVEVTRVDTLY